MAASLLLLLLLLQVKARAPKPGLGSLPNGAFETIAPKRKRNGGNLWTGWCAPNLWAWWVLIGKSLFTVSALRL